MSDAAVTLKSALPPGTPQSERSEAYRALRNEELAREWVRLHRLGEDRGGVLAEFNRRYWAEQELRAEAGEALRLYPPWRVLPQSHDGEIVGVDPFA